MKQLIRGTRILAGDTFRAATLEICGERIESVGAYEDSNGVDNVLDLGDAPVLPGVVDTHVHVNEPGRTEWEGFATATRAAAAGGITSLVDMPLNAIPPTTTLEGLRAKQRAAAGKVFVDVGFWGGVIPGNVDELAPMREAGVCGFKCFLAPSGVDEFPHVDEVSVRPAMEFLSHIGTPLLVHAELPGPLAEAEPLVRAMSPVKYLSYLASRPAKSEDEAVALMIRLGEELRTSVHIVHHASASGLPLIYAARDNGVPITAESCPHYLHWNAENIPDGATAFKCAPPIREAAHREQLWEALGTGTLDMVVSDHSPCTPELKKLDEGDFFEAWGGISSVQLSLAITWTECRARGIPLDRLGGWLSSRPARLAGLEQKGALVPGKDADFIVFDPDATFTPRGSDLAHRHPVTPYEGDSLHGVVRATFLRGRKIYENGQFLGTPQGALLQRP